jgi:hypothetical protein
MTTQICALMMLVLVAFSCGSKSKTEDTSTTTESAAFTELKAIMVTDCAASCHTGQDWRNSETIFKANLVNIQSYVALGQMPKNGTLSAEKKAKFAAYK